MIKSIDLRVDLSDDYINKDIILHEGDVNGTELVLSVYDNNSEFDLTGCTAAYDATIAGCLAEEAAAATIADTNKIKIPVTTNMTAFNGLLLIDVKIKKNDDILTVYTVSANVNRAVINGSTVIDISGTSIIQRLANAVPKTRKIAGIDLQDDITVLELFTALLNDKHILNQGYCIIDGSTEPPTTDPFMADATDKNTVYAVYHGIGRSVERGRMIYVEDTGSAVIYGIQFWLNTNGLRIRRKDLSVENAQFGNWITYLTSEDVYTKNEINEMIGDIESLLAEV